MKKVGKTQNFEEMMNTTKLKELEQSFNKNKQF